MQNGVKGATVAIALSGGVDSTAAAIKLIEEGYTCFGVTMYLFDVPDADGFYKPPEFLEDARRVAEALKIPHHILDMREIFKSRVMDAFAQAYLSGKTPNPCVLCNRTIKYGLLMDKALELGADYMATGHYARVLEDSKTGKLGLYMGCADRKDQAYVMYGLSQKQLSKIMFPNGAYTSKQVVRDIVSRHGIFTAQKKDSMGICFAPDGDYGRIIEALYPGSIKEGNFVDMKGNVLGRHRGCVYYTIGQKRGLGIETESSLFVVEIKPQSNEVVLGLDEETYARKLRVSNFHLIEGPQGALPKQVKLKMFNWGLMLDAEATVLENGDVIFEFNQPERAPVCGQHAVLYDGMQILGGGKIIEVIK